MAIQFYTGTGGVHAMFRKLAEVWSFQKTVGEDGVDLDNPKNTDIIQLWLTDEIYIRYGSDSPVLVGWANLKNTAGASSNIFACQNGEDTRTWKIVKTDCGVAFGVEANDVSVFVGRTIASDGTESIGVVARLASTSAEYYCYTDGMTNAVDFSAVTRDTTVHYTRLSNVVPKTTPVYFPDIYYVESAMQSSNRVTQIGGDVFYCTNYIAIRDTAAAAGSVDLSGYYNAAQTDAKIKAVETVLSEEITAVSEAVQAAQTAADTANDKADAAMSAAEAAQQTADGAQETAAEVQAALAEAVARLQKRHQQSIKVYVSPSGSDSNDGMTSGTAFATLGRALEATAGYGSEYIQLAAGTYDVPDKLLSLYKRMVVIAGAGQDDTTIRGCLALYGTILVLATLTLDGTDADYADQSVSAPLRAMRASDVRALSCTIRSASTYCAAVAESSHLDMQNCTFVGASTNCVFVTTFGDATLLSCTDTTGMPLICGGGCTAMIAKSTSISWTAANNGIVWVDGVQKSPVDMTTGVVQGSNEVDT